MYDYEWDNETGGYQLTTRTGRFVANEIRPVFAEEFTLTGLDQYFEYDHSEKRPLMWAQKNVLYYHGEKVVEFKKTRYGKNLEVTCFFDGKKNISAVNVEAMIEKNASIMRALVDDSKRRTKELYDADVSRCDKVYIAFSGGKDSVALLHLCDEILPLDVPVIFSDTDMELPDTYVTWDEIRKRYPKRTFIIAKSGTRAIDNWELFGPPSRNVRWCCSVHKSTPALIELKKLVDKDSVRVMAFVGVRGEESFSRSFYEDSNDGIKNASQLNRMPLLDWGAHELWLYIFRNDLYINRAYRHGLPRVGCVMCPECSEKYLWLVNSLYPNLLRQYIDIVVKTGNKELSDEKAKTEYIGELKWQARQSGTVLNSPISEPIESSENLTLTFKSSFFDEKLFKTWLKPIGRVVLDPETGGTKLSLPRTLDDGIPFSYRMSYAGGGSFTFHFHSDDERLAITPVLRTMARKISACVACRVCESECTHGALLFKDGVMQINEESCVHCMKCFNNIDKGCWRYRSMYKCENGQKNKMNSINRYKNFGLREKDPNLWVSTLVDMREHFFPWFEKHPLGNKMIESAGAWFSQCELIEGKSRKPTILVDMMEKYGADSELGWEFIWMALANNALLIKWYIVATTIGVSYKIEKLAEMLTVGFSELGASAVSGGLAAFKDMIGKSPLGDEGGMVTYEMKGRSIDSVTRLSKSVKPLTILYGLYLISRLSDRSTFTVTELLDADMDSTFISPIVAFGVSSSEFKRICDGLYTRYPDFIATTFTHGNDEIRVYPDKFSTQDVISLAIQEG